MAYGHGSSNGLNGQAINDSDGHEADGSHKATSSPNLSPYLPKGKVLL